MKAKGDGQGRAVPQRRYQREHAKKLPGGDRALRSDLGGYLPTTGASVVRYLAEYADKLSINTLKQRLAALAQWHITQGYPDPTKTPDVRQMIKGIKVVHPARVKQAAPLLLKHLEQAVTWL